MSVHAAKILKPYQKASIVVSCAHRWEAQPFIDSQDLKAQGQTPFPFPLFANEEGLLVLLTGQGSVRAAAAVSALLSHMEPCRSEPLVLANFGIAGAWASHWDLAQWLLINKVSDEGTQRSYFPDRLLPSPVAETFCLSVPKPANQANFAPSRAVYDMEASGIASAGELYLSSSQLVIGKFVSDHLETQTPLDWKELALTLEHSYTPACREFYHFLKAHRATLCSDSRSTEALRADHWVSAALQSLAHIPFTVSQVRQLRGRLKAYGLGCQVEQERGAKLEELSQIANSTKGETKSDHNRLLERLFQALSTPPLFSPLR